MRFNQNKGRLLQAIHKTKTSIDSENNFEAKMSGADIDILEIDKNFYTDEHILYVFFNNWLHAESCDEKDCEVVFCERLKPIVQHTIPSDKFEEHLFCSDCLKIFLFVMYHALGCQNPRCNLRNCVDIQEALQTKTVVYRNVLPM